MCRLGVFCDLWKNTSLHATLEKKSTLLLCSTVVGIGGGGGGGQVILVTMAIEMLFQWLSTSYINDILLDRLYYTLFCWSTFAAPQRGLS